VNPGLPRSARLSGFDARPGDGPIQRGDEIRPLFDSIAARMIYMGLTTVPRQNPDPNEPHNPTNAEVHRLMERLLQIFQMRWCPACPVLDIPIDSVLCTGDRGPLDSVMQTITHWIQTCAQQWHQQRVDDFRYRRYGWVWLVWHWNGVCPVRRRTPAALDGQTGTPRRHHTVVIVDNETGAFRFWDRGGARPGTAPWVRSVGWLFLVPLCVYGGTATRQPRGADDGMEGPHATV